MGIARQYKKGALLGHAQMGRVYANASVSAEIKLLLFDKKQQCVVIANSILGTDRIIKVLLSKKKVND